MLPIVFCGESLIESNENSFVSVNVHPDPFSERIAEAQPDETKHNYTIDIAFDSCQMTVPSEYILASLVH